MHRLKAAACIATACLLLALGLRPILAQSEPPSPANDVSLDEMIGQMLIVGFRGTSPRQAWPKRIRDQLESGEIGGVIFLKNNLSSARNAKALTRSFREAGAKHPPLITVDQEGGSVQRLAGNVGLRRRLSVRAVAARFTPEQAYDYYRSLARDLKSFGFNVNLGPVVDVNTNPRNPIIGRMGRAFSRDPETVTKYGAAFVRAHQAEGIITSLKHFPGHGSGRTDSHIDMVDISRSWDEQELEPFAQLIAENLADTVMIGHLHVASLQQGEAAKLPATFSPALLEGVLRGRLRFDGVIISDDLEMGAIRRYYRPREALIRAIKAGNDLLILSNTHRPDPAKPARAVASIRQAAEQDPELKDRIVDAYNRIIALKQRYLGPKSRASAN